MGESFNAAIVTGFSVKAKKPLGRLNQEKPRTVVCHVQEAKEWCLRMSNIGAATRVTYILVLALTAIGEAKIPLSPA